MPKVTYCNATYECTTAIKGDTYIRLLDENDNLIIDFNGISDFSVFSISDGTWTTPEDADDCYIVVMRRDGTLVKTNKKACDLAAGSTSTFVGSITPNPNYVPMSAQLEMTISSYTAGQIGDVKDKLNGAVLTVFMVPMNKTAVTYADYPGYIHNACFCLRLRDDGYYAVHMQQCALLAQVEGLDYGWSGHETSGTLGTICGTADYDATAKKLYLYLSTTDYLKGFTRAFNYRTYLMFLSE